MNLASAGAQTTWTAGQRQTLKFAGTTPHFGGSCQYALSYDMGKTFNVFYSELGGCMYAGDGNTTTPKSSFQIPLPKKVPSGQNVLFAWYWQSKNAASPEAYHVSFQSPIKRRIADSQACSVINIEGGGNEILDEKDYPPPWTGYMEAKPECTYTNGNEMVYPHPGKNFVYGGTLAATKPPPGHMMQGTNCEHSGGGMKSLPAGGGGGGGGGAGGNSGSGEGASSGNGSGGGANSPSANAGSAASPSVVQGQGAGAASTAAVPAATGAAFVDTGSNAAQSANTVAAMPMQSPAVPAVAANNGAPAAPAAPAGPGAGSSNQVSAGGPAAATTAAAAGATPTVPLNGAAPCKKVRRRIRRSAASKKALAKRRRSRQEAEDVWARAVEQIKREKKWNEDLERIARRAAGF